MASCDDDFSLLGEDHHPHHIFQPPQEQQQQPYAPHSFAPRHAPQSQPLPQQIPENVAVECGTGDEEEVNETESTFTTFDNNTPVNIDVRTTEKRKDGETLNNGDTASPGPYTSKKAKTHANEYRKDREEWSDAAIGCLLDGYLDKFRQLNRGNLRGRDWEEVAVAVSERCEKQSKSVEQCKNKVDNLKKRYKLERQRMINGGISTSHWPWFRKMEEIVGNSITVKSVIEEDKGSASASGLIKQSKRFVPGTPNSTGQINNSKAKQGPRWRRVVFKISGDALCGNHNNIDPKVAMLIASEVVTACRHGVEVAIVVGGSNFFSGNTWVTETGSDRSTAYQIGMMASVMNSILLQSALEKMGAQAHVQTAFTVPEVTEPYNRQRAIRHLEKGRVVVFGGIGAGIGNPLFSTDTAAALRASEIHADVILKGTTILHGVYDCQSRDNNATFEHISFRELGSRGTIPMDPMALSFCDENGIPVVVFDLLEPGNISKAICGDQVGTFIDQNGRIS